MCEPLCFCVCTGASVETGEEVRATVLDLDLVEHRLALSLNPGLLIPTNTRVLRSATKKRLGKGLMLIYVMCS